MREWATIEQLEGRIKKMEERIFMHDKAIKRLFDLFQGSIDTQPKQSKGDQERSKTESNERLNRIMRELGYKIE